VRRLFVSPFRFEAPVVALLAVCTALRDEITGIFVDLLERVSVV
jgi:hypothetical protein